MAKIPTHGALRLFFGSKLKDPFKFRLGFGGEKKKILFLDSPIGFHRSRAGVSFSGFARVCSPGKESSGLKGVELLKEDGDGDAFVEEDVGFGEFERDGLSCFRGLVLDIPYRPVNVVCWKRAICLEFTEKADVLEYYNQTVSSAHGSFYIPAVLRVPHLLQVIKRRRIKHNVSRKSIYHRDSYTCQYCSSKQNLTIDHVLPIPRGGEWAWDNLKAIHRCDCWSSFYKTMEEANMKLLKIPKVTKDFDIVAIPLTRKGVPEEWQHHHSDK